MRNKRFVKHTSRAFAILMSAMMAVGIAMPVNAAGKKDSKKEDKTETVYVNANADGSVDKITVSDWLKNHSSSDTYGPRARMPASQRVLLINSTSL